MEKSPPFHFFRHLFSFGTPLGLRSFQCRHSASPGKTGRFREPKSHSTAIPPHVVWAQGCHVPVRVRKGRPRTAPAQYRALCPCVQRLGCWACRRYERLRHSCYRSINILFNYSVHRQRYQDPRARVHARSRLLAFPAPRPRATALCRIISQPRVYALSLTDFTDAFCSSSPFNSSRIFR